MKVFGQVWIHLTVTLTNSPSFTTLQGPGNTLPALGFMCAIRYTTTGTGTRSYMRSTKYTLTSEASQSTSSWSSRASPWPAPWWSELAPPWNCFYQGLVKSCQV